MHAYFCYCRVNIILEVNVGFGTSMEQPISQESIYCGLIFFVFAILSNLRNKVFYILDGYSFFYFFLKTMLLSTSHTYMVFQSSRFVSNQEP